MRYESVNKDLAKRSADIPVRLGLLNGAMPTRMSALQFKERTSAGGGRTHSRASAGLARMDVLFLVAGVVIVGGVLWLALSAGEMRRTWGCKQRLKDLAAAFESYSKDHDNALPPAALVEEDIAWDRLIAGYLISASNGSSGGGGTGKDEQAAKFFHCPSDEEPRGEFAPRSYSMPMYDIRKQGWPADEEAPGGVGLYLDERQLAQARQQPGVGSEGVPVLTAGQVPAPAETALLVERIAIRNALWGTVYACTIAPREQWEAKTLEREKFHRGRFNYLMLDGHVELLTERRSGGHLGTGGVWTIDPRD